MATIAVVYSTIFVCAMPVKNPLMTNTKDEKKDSKTAYLNKANTGF